LTESALDRTARALDLVPYLLEHQGISITELAQVFGVSEKQINEDLILIHMCGLPGYTPLELIEMYYEDGYVTVSDPQSLNRPRSMNRAEITSLLVSLDLLKSTRSDNIAAEIEALKRKLRNSLNFENPYVVVADSRNSELVEQIEVAIAKGNSLEIVYLSGSKDKSTTRIILPLELYQENSFTYLNAWCQLSEGERTFRLDRLVSLKLSDTQKISYTGNYEQKIDQRASIQLTVSRPARNFIEENRGVIESIVEGEELRVTLHPIDVEWLCRTVLGYGSAIKVVEPKQLSEELVSRAKAIRELYRDYK
jgi:proteasome accessory factor C